ncbi:transposase [Mesorhizobium sp.]|uniref:transposase n=1 Tax=Mesorhizobium sp. TaxID=1871066 RepID=UPI0025BA74A8|nr:transposase [Mesorhizobium sp.]
MTPKRFRRSRSVGAYLGLTPRRYQSGEVDRVGRITKVGDSETRTALFEAANVILRPTTRRSSMKAWAMKIAIDRVPDVRRSPWPDEWQSPFTACGLTNRISVGRQLRLSWSTE